MKPHTFVAMPFGSKPGADGRLIDFNRVYEEYIQAAPTTLCGCGAQKPVNQSAH